MGVQRGVVAVALLALLASCGDDSSVSPKADKSDGGTQSKPGGKHDGGNGGNAGQDAGSGQGGDSDASVTGGSDGTGDFSSIWKRSSSDVTIIDNDNPSDISQKTVKLPPTLAEPVEGRKVDIYQQIKGDTLFTYAYLDGDDVYYRTSTELLKSDTIYIASTGEQSIFQLEDGHLTETRGIGVGNFTISMHATYTAYSGKFPPSGWPAKMVAP